MARLVSPASGTGVLDRLRGRHRILVTNLLLAALFAATAAQVWSLWTTWRRAETDLGFLPMPPGQEPSRLLTMFGMLQYGYGPVQNLTPLALAAAVGVLVLVGHGSAERLPLGWRRGVAALAAGALALIVVQAAARLLIIVNGFSAIPDSMREIYFFDSDPGTALVVAATPLSEVLIGGALIVLALASWPGGPTGLLPDDEDELEDLPDGPGSQDTGAFAPPEQGQPNAAEEPSARAAAEPRLRADGSSESGYDPFRFGR